MARVICPVCKKETGGPGYRDDYCPTCQTNYRAFCAELPKEWKKHVSSCSPSYEEWVEEQLIRQDEFDGKITHAQAEERAAALIKRIQLHLKPLAKSQTERTKPRSYNDLPSYFIEACRRSR